jgi:protein gp37
MGIHTDIQWSDSTVNPTMGCDGCELWGAKQKTCYAGVLHGRYGGTNKGFAPTFEQVTAFPGRMAKAAAWSDLTGTVRADKPWFTGMPRVIFVSDMSDALSKAVTFDYLKAEIIDVVSSEKGRRHIWMWLTKQAPRMAEFSAWLASNHGCGWPMNLWAGTSITTQATASRAKALRSVGDGNTTRFISAEPLWEPVDLSEWLPWFRLVITGGESGPGARPCDVAWVRSVVEQCKAAAVPVFVKQLGAHVQWDGCQGGYLDGPSNCWPIDTVAQWDGRLKRVILKDKKGGDMAEWPEDLRVRQFPTEARAARC